MSDIEFDDLRIHGRTTLVVGEHSVTVPSFLPDEVEAIAASVSRQAEAYHQSGRDPLRSMGEVFARWADPDDPARREALPVLADVTGFSQEAIARFGLWPLGKLSPSISGLKAQQDAIGALIESEGYRSFSRWGDGWIRAHGTPNIRREPDPSLVLHSLAGNVVGPMWLSLLYALGGRVGQVLKLSADDPAAFPFLLSTLAEVDPDLRSTIACGYYPGGSDVQRQMIGMADVVFALGADATMHALQEEIDRVSARTRLVAHGQKIGFQVIARDYVREEAAELVAWGVSACDGNACFSPANVYVERGGPLTPREFAEAVTQHMARIAQDVPPKRSIRVAERISDFRQLQLQRRLLGQQVTLLKSPGTDWTVVLDEEELQLAPTCQERTVVVRPVDAVDDVPAYVRHLGGNLQTVGLAVGPDRLLSVAEDLGAVGVTNLKMLGTEYIIGIDEPHDGVFDPLRLTMSDSLRWTHLAFSDTDEAFAAALHENRTASVASPGGVEAGTAVS